jgi:hypothetical protein
MQPDGQAIAVGNPPNFPAFANASFFAGTTCPSTNACAHSIFPWASNLLNNARQSHFHVFMFPPWTKRKNVASRLQVSRLRMADFPERIQS